MLKATVYSWNMMIFITLILHFFTGWTGFFYMAVVGISVMLAMAIMVIGFFLLVRPGKINITMTSINGAMIAEYIFMGLGTTYLCWGGHYISGALYIAVLLSILTIRHLAAQLLKR